MSVSDITPKEESNVDAEDYYSEEYREHHQKIPYKTYKKAKGYMQFKRTEEDSFLDGDEDSSSAAPQDAGLYLDS